MVIDIQEAYNLMEFLKKLKPEAGVHVAEQMVGKFEIVLKSLIFNFIRTGSHRIT